MTEIVEPGVLETPKKRRKLKISDIVTFGVLIIVIALLATTLLHRLRLKHEVAAAEVVSDKVVHAMATQNTAAIHALGDKKFQTDHSATELNSKLTTQTDPPLTFAALYGDSTPTIDRQIVANNSRGKHVAVIYKYSKLKVPLYVRIDVGTAGSGSTWYMQALSVSSDESRLTATQ